MPPRSSRIAIFTSACPCHLFQSSPSFIFSPRNYPRMPPCSGRVSLGPPTHGPPVPASIRHMGRAGLWVGHTGRAGSLTSRLRMRVQQDLSATSRNGCLVPPSTYQTTTRAPNAPCWTIRSGEFAALASRSLHFVFVATPYCSAVCIFACRHCFAVDNVLLRSSVGRHSNLSALQTTHRAVNVTADGASCCIQG